jgi:DUF218 domain-containing protein
VPSDEHRDYSTVCSDPEGAADMYYQMMIVALSGFDADGEPTEFTRRRIDAAMHLVKRYGIPFMVLSGGSRGAFLYNKKHTPTPTAAVATEASLAKDYILRTFIVPRWTSIVVDGESEETIGNVVIPVYTFAKHLGLRRIVCVTSSFHATRVQQLYDYCCQEENVSVAVVPVDYEEYRIDEVVRGRDFVDSVKEWINAERIKSDRSVLDLSFEYVRTHHEPPLYRLDASLLGIKDRVIRLAENDIKVKQRFTSVREANSVFADWQRQWQEPEERKRRIALYDAFAKTPVDKRSFFRYRHARDILSCEALVVEAGRLLAAADAYNLAEMLLHEIPARLWFLGGQACARPNLTGDDLRAFLALVSLSCKFLIDRDQPLVIYAETHAQPGERIFNDPSFGIIELQAALTQIGEMYDRLSVSV